MLQTESAEAAAPRLSEIVGLRQLQAFSERLMTLSSVDELLEALLDEVIDYCGAARGVQAALRAQPRP